MKMRNFILCFLTIIVMLISLEHPLEASLSPDLQKLALFRFKQSFRVITPSFDTCYYFSYEDHQYSEIPSRPKTMNWSMSSDHCTWDGVSCDQKTGEVIGLDLTCSGLYGAILPDSTLFHLSHLRFLNLSQNYLGGSNQFPQEFGFFAKGLTHLNLSSTGLSGRVPSGISHLYKLVSLDLSGSGYNNVVKLDDEVFKSLMQNLTHLRMLNLYEVNISSSVLPVNISNSLRFLNLEYTHLHGVVPQEVFRLPNLELLSLTSSELTAKLPKVEWGSSATLQHLFLDGVNIDGGIPDSIGSLESLVTLGLLDCNLSGPIPRSIGNLVQLTSLGLDQNDLNGPILTYLTNLTNLRSLSLYDNNFTGSLPSWLFHYPVLETLYLANNAFTGQLHGFDSSQSPLQCFSCHNNLLYGSIPHSFSQLVNLAQLDFSSNNFSGVLDLEMFSGLENLEYLDLSGNSLSVVSTSRATLPAKLSKLVLSSCNMKEFPHFSKENNSLGFLDLSNNEIEGEIPHWIGSVGRHSVGRYSDYPSHLNLSHNKLIGSLEQLPWGYIKSLFLQHNNLNGSFPTLMCNSSPLVVLNLSHNNIHGNIPETLPNFHNLVTINLNGNNLEGRIPSSFAEFYSLRVLDLGSNQINDTFPHFLEALPNLQVLVLKSNEFHGQINQSSKIEHPFSMLKSLDLSFNGINGSLGRWICNLSSLEILNLSHNNLSGVLPICTTNLTQFSVFDLRMNNIQGSLPSTLSNLRNLTSLNLHGNKLQGKIPSSFAEFDKLETLDLGSNLISDVFPVCLEALPNLQVLVLKSNRFHGLINKGSKTEHPFPSLRIIDLSYNQFSGPLPAIYINNFKAMMNGDANKVKPSYMGNGYYSDSTSLVIKGVEIELVRILTVFTTIDLSSNNFEDEIDEYIGNLLSLRYLNISHNRITGHIPSLLGELSMLESLDLSFNRLEGEIPLQLTGIYSLARLNLSYNQLSGHIPRGAQFNTFDNDSYVGNRGLCGFPLSEECKHDIETQEEDEDYFFNGFTWEAVVIGYGCGVVPAFIIGYLMLLAGKPKWFAGIIGRELGLKIRRMEIKWRY